MKHLKTYQLFESVDIDTINDFFLEIQDLGFYVNIHQKLGSIYIRIRKVLTDSEFEQEFSRPEFRTINMGSFRLSLIKDSILSVISYLTEMGFDLESIFCFGGDFNKSDKNFADMELDEFEQLSGNTFLSTLMMDFKLKQRASKSNESLVDMIKNYSQFINENHYLDLSECIKTLNDICYDLKDEGITYQIQPDNEIKVKMLSLSLSGKIEPRDIDFYLNIDTVNKKLTDGVTNGMFSAPEWFVDVLNRIEDYMSGIGFGVLYTAIYYSGDKEYLDDFNDIQGLIKAIRLDFKSRSKSER